MLFTCVLRMYFIWMQVSKLRFIAHTMLLTVDMHAYAVLDMAAHSHAGAS